MKTPTEVQADMIRELEAKVSLLLDDLFYARAEIAKMPSDIYLCPPTSENDYEGLKWCDAYEELERENAALREEVVKANGLLDMQMKELAKLRGDSKIVEELCALHGCGKEFLMVWCRAAAYAQKAYTRKEVQP